MMNENYDEEIYKVAFDLLLKDTCLNDSKWLGSLDELYEGRRMYYINKAIDKIKECAE